MPAPAFTSKQVANAIEVLRAVYEAVAAAGAAGVPAGTVYAALMGAGCTLEQYQRIEGVLVRSGLVEKRGQLLTAAPLPGRQP